MTELASAFPCRRALTPDAELAQDPHQPRPPGDPPDVQRTLEAIRPDAHQGDISRGLGLKTRGLDTLPRKKAVDRAAMNAEDTADTHRIEPAVVDQSPDGLRMHAQLVRHFANADEPWLSACRRHDHCEALQVLRPRA